MRDVATLVMWGAYRYCIVMMRDVATLVMWGAYRYYVVMMRDVAMGGRP